MSVFNLNDIGNAYHADADAAQNVLSIKEPFVGETFFDDVLIRNKVILDGVLQLKREDSKYGYIEIIGSHDPGNGALSDRLTRYESKKILTSTGNFSIINGYSDDSNPKGVIFNSGVMQPAWGAGADVIDTNLTAWNDGRMLLGSTGSRWTHIYGHALTITRKIEASTAYITGSINTGIAVITGTATVGSNLTAGATTVTSLTTSGGILTAGATEVTGLLVNGNSLSTGYVQGSWLYANNGIDVNSCYSLNNRVRIDSTQSGTAYGSHIDMVFKFWTKTDGNPSPGSHPTYTAGERGEPLRIRSHNTNITWTTFYTKGTNWLVHSSNPNVGLMLSCRSISVNGTDVTSDDRLKHNEQPISNALEVVRRLSPQVYDKSVSLDALEQTTRDAGFIAQEVHQIPELSHFVTLPETDPEVPNPNLLWRVNYTPLFTYAVAAVKELDAIVQAQQSTIDSLEARLTALENK